MFRNDLGSGTWKTKCDIVIYLKKYIFDLHPLPWNFLSDESDKVVFFMLMRLLGILWVTSGWKLVARGTNHMIKVLDLSVPA